MPIGNSVEKNLPDMLLDLYHGKKRCLPVVKKACFLNSHMVNKSSTFLRGILEGAG